MLLKIEEPNQSGILRRHKFAAGIDFGTTNSLIASVKEGEARVLLDSENRGILPSIVNYASGELLVGHNAKERAKIESKNTIFSIKRLVGRSFDDIQNCYPLLPYTLKKGESGLPILETNQGDKSPVEISSEILKVLGKRAEERLGGELSGVVITVPAYFDDIQRMCIKNAANLAGLRVLRLLNEPTAAALAYGLDSGREGVIAVYDLGGGTFDISILRLSKGVFEVLATMGDSALGGDDFDNLVAEYFQAKANLKGKLSSEQKRELLDIAIDAKTRLSYVDFVEVSIFGWIGTFTCEEFNALIQPLVKKTLILCSKALKDAEVDISRVIEVVMVGGSTRIPLVLQMVGDFLNCVPLTSINPDETVAIGAAIQADLLVGNRSDLEVLLLDVIPLSLGIETVGGVVEKIIPRNTIVPVARAQEFTTYKNAQTAMTIHVVQGEREMADGCRSLARFTLKKIPSMTAGAAKIRVIYQVDADGLLSVTATEKSSGVKADIQVKPSYGLGYTEAISMLKDSVINAKEDADARAFAEQRVAARGIIEALVAAMKADAEVLLSSEEKKHLSCQIQKLITLCDNGNASEIERGIKELDKASQKFASSRIEQSIRSVLLGHSIDDI
ncbi:chaperone protein [Candidatus Photodesmus blepharus]|uniref:Chaperone protein HscA homolog n=1 Tax=Candidatus Photodesmus blepharonis TaxID=1179155 RepID=A0A084CPG4_9GAMM|nr:chaperone protein [Candidatus Photodesmus blepharus]